MTTLGEREGDRSSGTRQIGAKKDVIPSILNIRTRCFHGHCTKQAGGSASMLQLLVAEQIDEWQGITGGLGSARRHRSWPSTICSLLLTNCPQDVAGKLTVQQG